MGVTAEKQLDDAEAERNADRSEFIKGEIAGARSS